MTFSNVFDLQFHQKNEDYSVRLKKIEPNERDSNYTVTLNGVKYSLLGQSDKIGQIADLLNFLSPLVSSESVVQLLTKVNLLYD